MKRLAFVALALSASPAMASGQLYYGSRAGMVVDLVSVSGLGTAQAVIHTRHTQTNAIAFCRDYVQKVTPKCIADEMAIPLNDEISANCIIGTFVDFGGHRYRFAGPSKGNDAMVKYRGTDLSTGEDADGSSASGYSTYFSLFKALCPVQAPPDIDR